MDATLACAVEAGDTDGEEPRDDPKRGPRQAALRSTSSFFLNGAEKECARARVCGMSQRRAACLCGVKPAPVRRVRHVRHTRVYTHARPRGYARPRPRPRTHEELCRTWRTRRTGAVSCRTAFRTCRTINDKIAPGRQEAAVDRLGTAQADEKGPSSTEALGLPISGQAPLVSVCSLGGLAPSPPSRNSCSGNAAPARHENRSRNSGSARSNRAFTFTRATRRERQLRIGEIRRSARPTKHSATSGSIRNAGHVVCRRARSAADARPRHVSPSARGQSGAH